MATTPDNRVFVDAQSIEAVQPAAWRLVIDDAPRSGAANMAIDQAIAEACAAGESLPTLRFYQWKPPAVSLGRHQARAEVDAEAIAAAWLRDRAPPDGRPRHPAHRRIHLFGGRSVCEPRLTGGVMDAYLNISNALLAGLQPPWRNGR